MCIPGIKGAILHAGGIRREVRFRARVKWDPKRTHRLSKLQGPADGLNDAPAPSHMSLQR